MTRKQAIENKEIFYQGKVCKRGHGNIRYVKGGSCVTCISEYCCGREYLLHKRLSYTNNKITKLQKMKVYYELNKDNRLKYLKSWQKENRHKTAMYASTRRARILNQTLCGTDFSMIEDIYKKCQNKTKTTGIPHHVDHIIPLSKGGKHHQDNLQIITARENLIKGSKLL